jgi:hypothetical protein
LKTLLTERYNDNFVAGASVTSYIQPRKVELLTTIFAATRNVNYEVNELLLER